MKSTLKYEFKAILKIWCRMVHKCFQQAAIHSEKYYFDKIFAI